MGFSLGHFSEKASVTKDSRRESEKRDALTKKEGLLSKGDRQKRVRFKGGFKPPGMNAGGVHRSRPQREEAGCNARGSEEELCGSSGEKNPKIRKPAREGGNKAIRRSSGNRRRDIS